MKLIEDLAREGIKAEIGPHGGRFRAALHHRDGALHVEHLACASRAEAEAWLAAQVKATYPNSYADRVQTWSGAS